MKFWNRVHRHDVAHLSKGVLKQLTLEYDIRQFATKTETIKYDIFNLVGKTRTLQWKMRQLATKTRELLYEINGDVSTALTLYYTNWGGTGKGNLVPPLPTLDEEPKHKVVQVHQVLIKASLNAQLNNFVPVSGRLKAEYTGKIRANTNKFYKLNKLTSVEARVSAPLKYPFGIDGKLLDVVKTGKTIAELNYKPILEIIRNNFMILEGRFETFTFEDANIPAVGDPINFDREPTFNNPSSFIGLVTYFPDTQDMIVVLNGKPYNYCNVPQRTFDAFKGADSPGAFYNRNIKGILVCI